MRTEVKMNAAIKLFLCLALVPWLPGCERGTPAQRASQATTDAAVRGATVAVHDTDQRITLADSQAIRYLPLMWMHLDWMARLSPAQLRQVLASHQQMAGRMIQMMEPKGMMGAGMKGGRMGMGPGSPWAALRDSIRDDLSALPGLSDKDLAARSQAHLDRMRRMMALGMGMIPGGGWADVHGGCGMLDSVGHMSAGQRQGIWAMHARMSSQMLSAMTANMQGRGAAPSAEWKALRDSLTQDMAEMPGLQGDSLRSRMQSHAERMHRLMALQAQALGTPMGPMGVGCW
jgi:hypothetical protein